MTTENDTARHDAATAALEALEGLEEEVDPTLIAKLKALAGQEPTAEETEKSEGEEGTAERLSRAMSDMADLEREISVRKAASPEAERLRQQVHKARQSVELEYLAQISPGGARAWESRPVGG